MKPQTQRWRRGAVFVGGEQTDEGGDCFAACIASILEVDIDGFPNFLASFGEITWWDRWQKFLYENYRTTLVYFDKEECFPDAKLIAWWIAEVMVGSIPHAVVFYKDQFRWDPLPDPFKNEYKASDSKSMTLICSIGSIIEDDH